MVPFPQIILHGHAQLSSAVRRLLTGEYHGGYGIYAEIENPDSDDNHPAKQDTVADPFPSGLNNLEEAVEADESHQYHTHVHREVEDHAAELARKRTERLRGISLAAFSGMIKVIRRSAAMRFFRYTTNEDLFLRCQEI